MLHLMFISLSGGCFQPNWCSICSGIGTTRCLTPHMWYEFQLTKPSTSSQVFFPRSHILWHILTFRSPKDNFFNVCSGSDIISFRFYCESSLLIHDKIVHFSDLNKLWRLSFIHTYVAFLRSNTFFTAWKLLVYVLFQLLVPRRCFDYSTKAS